MKDFQAILSKYKEVDFGNRKAALATVVQVKGSSYRSPGARMLILDNGRWYGSISGGCLEGDALRKARQVMKEGIPVTVTYDTREESNQNLGINLGCNGIIDVLIEPITEERNPLHQLSQLELANKPVAMATVFESSSINGEKALLTADGQQLWKLSDANFNELVVEDLSDLFQSKKSFTQKYENDGQSIQVFIEFIQPSIALIIFGGGFDARPLSQLAKTLGWNVSITDECAAHVAPVFFPTADHVSLCSRDFIDRDFDIASNTVCVLMSHNYEYDRDVVKKLIGSQSPYIGILGPRKRFDKMLTEFETQGLTLSEEDFERIHSPIGLDIAAETPEEIAVSIVAEIQAKLHNRDGRFLKEREAPIHVRDIDSAQVLKMAYL